MLLILSDSHWNLSCSLIDILTHCSLDCAESTASCLWPASPRYKYSSWIVTTNLGIQGGPEKWPKVRCDAMILKLSHDNWHLKDIDHGNWGKTAFRGWSLTWKNTWRASTRNSEMESQWKWKFGPSKKFWILKFKQSWAIYCADSWLVRWHLYCPATIVMAK